MTRPVTQSNQLAGGKIMDLGESDNEKKYRTDGNGLINRDYFVEPRGVFPLPVEAENGKQNEPEQVDEQENKQEVLQRQVGFIGRQSAVI